MYTSLTHLHKSSQKLIKYDFFMVFEFAVNTTKSI